MATIPELLDGHITLEVECLDRLYLNGYIGKLATGPGLVFFVREQLGKPVPSPVVLGQISERFREPVKAQDDFRQRTEEHGDQVDRSRLMVDARKWLASKLAPKKYCDKIDTTLQGPDGGPIQEHLVVEYIRQKD